MMQKSLDCQEISSENAGRDNSCESDSCDISSSESLSKVSHHKAVESPEFTDNREEAITPEDLEKFPEIIKLRNRQKSAKIGRLFLALLAFRPLVTGAMTDSNFSAYLSKMNFTAEEITDTLMPLAFLLVWTVFKNYRIGYVAALAIFVSVIWQLVENPWLLSIHPIINGYFLCIAVVAYGAHSQGVVERMKPFFKNLV